MEHTEKLPDGWIKVKSKSKPGKVYFFNRALNVSVWRIEDLEKYKPNDKTTIDKKTPKKTPPKAALNPPLKASTSFKVGKKNGAKERMTNLYDTIQAEVKVSKAREGNNGSSTVKPAKSLESVHLGGLRGIVKLREEKLPNKDVKNGALKRMTSFRKQQSDNSEPSNKKKEENNNVVKPEAHKTETESDVDMMDVSFEDAVESQALSEYESMEWEDIPEQEVIQHVQKVRTTVNSGLTSLEPPKSNLPSKERHVVDFFVVCDTNVLLSNIDFLKEIKGRMFKGRTVQFSPVFVFQEISF